MEVVSLLIDDHCAQRFELSERDRYKGWRSGQLRTSSKAAIRTNGAHTKESSASISRIVCQYALVTEGFGNLRQTQGRKAEKNDECK